MARRHRRPVGPSSSRRPAEHLEGRTLLAAANYFAIRVVDAATGRGVPQADLVMTDGTRYTTDSGGTVAFNRAGYLNTADTFVLESYGYALASGTRSFTVTPTLGGSTTVPLARTQVAQRMYRESGEDLYKQTVAVGGTSPVTTTNANPNLSNAYVFGQDSGLTAVYKGKLYEFWGDTGVDTNYDGQDELGNFRTTGGVMSLPANGGLDPAAGENISYFVDGNSRPKAMFPTASFGLSDKLFWASSPIVTHDAGGAERMVIAYAAVDGSGAATDKGFGVWNDSTQQFDKIASFPTTAPVAPGQNATHATFDGLDYWVIPNGNSFIRVRDTYADVTNINSYQVYTPLKPGTTFTTTNAFGGNTITAANINTDAATGKVVWTWAANTTPINGVIYADLANRGLVPWAQNPFAFADADSSGHVAFSTSAVSYNDYLKAWTFIGQQSFGSSFIGEVWYATAPTVTGPWALARKVQTDARTNGVNDPYTFYNLIQHPYYDANSPYLYYSGTYTGFLVDGGLQGQYFANADLTGYAYKQTDGPINATYAAKSPNAALIANTDNFSVKWTGKIQLDTAGTYQFRVTTDAGAKLIVGGTTVVNQFAAATATTYTGSYAATTGSKAIELDYRSLTSTAAGVKLEWLVPGSTTWATVPGSALSHNPAQPIDNYNTVMYRVDLSDSRLASLPVGTGLGVQYFDNRDLTGYVSTAANTAVNAAWADGTSPVAGVAPTTYSARYAGLLQAPATNAYTLYVTSQGGVRVWLGDRILVDHWDQHATTTDTAAVALTAGQRNNLRVEYANDAGPGQVKLEWSSPTLARQVIPASALYATPNGLLATYFDEKDLTSPKVTTRVGTLNFALPSNNGGSPDPSTVVNDGRWSARYAGQVRPDYTGAYTFTATSDDGVRLWVNGVKLADGWFNHGAIAYSGTIDLVAGQQYDIVVDYYNELSVATAKLAWSNADQTAGVSTIVPEANLLAAPAFMPLQITAANAYLKLNADGQRVDLYNNATGTGTPALQWPRSMIVCTQFLGTAGADKLTVDFSAGNPLLVGGLSFDGGAGGTNTLAVVGSAGDDAVTVGNSTVAVATPAGLALLTYANATALTFAGGAGADTLTQSAQPGNGTTSLTFVAPTAADTLAVTGGTFTLPAPAAGAGSVAVPLNAVAVSAAGRLVLATAASTTDWTVLDVRQLSLAGPLDLGGNVMIVRNGNLAAVTAAVAAGFAGGTWTGPGVADAVAAADGDRLSAVGVIANAADDGTALYATFAGQAVSAADVLVRHTTYGDANLDGRVDGADYTRVDSGYLFAATGWAAGDFNYDSFVDASDYTLIDNAFNHPVALPAAAAARVAVVPPVAAVARAVPPLVKRSPSVTAMATTDEHRRKRPSADQPSSPDRTDLLA